MSTKPYHIITGINVQTSTSAGQSYCTFAAFGLVVDVRDVNTDQVLADSSATVVVGPTVGRDLTFYHCGGWSRASSGGQGVMVDSWDIRAIPTDAVFEFFSMHVAFLGLAHPDHIHSSI